MKNIFLLTCLAPTLMFAQAANDPNAEDSTDTNQKCIKVISIAGYMGGDFYRDGFEDRTIFRQAVPSSSMAYADLTGYSNQPGYMPYVTNAGNMTNGMSLSVRLRCQQKFSELNVGIAHTNLNIASQYYYKNTRTRIDTTVLPGGEILYTDSVNSAHYLYNWNSDMITLHLGWTVHTNTRRLMNLYTGIGFYGGFGFNGVYQAEHYSYSQREYNSETPGSYISYSGTTEVLVDEREAFKTPMFSSYAVYVPVGFNVRLSKRQNFFGHIAIFGEYRGALQFILPSGVDTKVRTVSAMNGGVRWYVHAPKYLNEDSRRHRRHRHHTDNGHYD